jgi:hypothetical protein
MPLFVLTNERCPESTRTVRDAKINHCLKSLSLKRSCTRLQIEIFELARYKEELLEVKNRCRKSGTTGLVGVDSVLVE